MRALKVAEQTAQGGKLAGAGAGRDVLTEQMRRERLYHVLVHSLGFRKGYAVFAEEFFKVEDVAGIGFHRGVGHAFLKFQPCKEELCRSGKKGSYFGNTAHAHTS